MHEIVDCQGHSHALRLLKTLTFVYHPKVSGISVCPCLGLCPAFCPDPGPALCPGPFRADPCRSANDFCSAASSATLGHGLYRDPGPFRGLCGGLGLCRAHGLDLYRGSSPDPDHGLFLDRGLSRTLSHGLCGLEIQKA